MGLLLKPDRVETNFKDCPQTGYETGPGKYIVLDKKESYFAFVIMSTRHYFVVFGSAGDIFWCIGGWVETKAVLRD